MMNFIPRPFIENDSLKDTIKSNVLETNKNLFTVLHDVKILWKCLEF